MLAAEIALTNPAQDELVSNVQLQLRDGRIASVATTKITKITKDAGKGLLALPAMVNAHDHGFGIQPLAFGCTDDCLECWIPGLGARPSTDPKLETKVAFGRMALAGIGSTMHCHNSLLLHQLEQEARAVSAAASQVGLRVGFSCPVVDDNAWAYGGPEKLRPFLGANDYQQLSSMRPPALSGQEQVARITAIANELERPGFTVQYGPIGPQWCKVETLAAIAEASANEERRVHMHLLESKRQRDWLAHVHPGGVVKMLDAIGLLSSRLTVAHGVWLDDTDCALLAQRGVTVTTNAACNLRLRSGLAPLTKFAKHGVAVAVGTDGLALNDNQDYMTELRLTRLLHGGTGLTPKLAAGPFLHQALTNGFHTVCGASDYGQLIPGSPADILLLDHTSLAQDLIIDTDAQTVALLHARMSAAHVRQLFVAGREIVRDGILQTLNFAAAEAELIAQAKAGSGEIVAKLALIAKQKIATRDYYTASKKHD